MKIRQCLTGTPFFKKAFFRKFGLVGYQRVDEPAIFFGVFGKQRERLLWHKSLAIVVWAGSDAMNLNKKDGFTKELKNRKNIKHIAISKFIEDDLKRIGIPYKAIPIIPCENKDIQPEPLGKDVYFYYGEKKQAFYGLHFATQLAAMFPNIKFHLCHKISHSRAELIKIYKKCFIGLRFTKHDGLSNTAIELGLMGRKVIWNGNTPNAINYKTFYDIIKIFKSELYKNTPGRINKRIANATKKYLDIPDDWLDTKFYEPNKKYLSTIPKKFEMKPLQITIIKGEKQLIIPKQYDVSIIINTINEHPVILWEAVYSYIRQKGVNIQIIISTIGGDPSILLAKRLKLDYVYTKYHGIYKQLNNALSLVKFPWFAYASGNDVAKNRKMYHEISMCISQKKKVCYSNFYKTNNSLAVIAKTNFPEKYVYAKHLKGNFVNDCAVMDSQLLKEYGPFRGKWGNFAYWDFWLRVFEGEGDVFCLNPNYDWFYRVNSDSKHVLRKSNPAEQEIYRKLLAKMIKSHENKIH